MRHRASQFRSIASRPFEASGCGGEGSGMEHRRCVEGTARGWRTGPSGPDCQSRGAHAGRLRRILTGQLSDLLPGTPLVTVLRYHSVKMNLPLGSLAMTVAVPRCTHEPLDSSRAIHRSATRPSQPLSLLAGLSRKPPSVQAMKIATNSRQLHEFIISKFRELYG